MTNPENILEKIAEILNGREMLSPRERLLVDCADEITRLRKSRSDVIDQAVSIVEKTNLKDKKSLAVKSIKELKNID